MTMMVKGHFVGKWKWGDQAGDATLDTLYKTYSSAIDLANRVGEKHAQLKDSGRLTASGVADELQNWVQTEAVAKLAGGRRALGYIKQQVKSKRDDLALKGPDKTDVAGALLRQELRSYIRNLEVSERVALLSVPDVDPGIALAVLEAPAALSGVTDNLRNRMIDQAMQALHPKAIAELQEIEDASEIAGNALRAATVELTSALRITERDLDDIMASVKFVQLHRSVENNESTGWKPKEIIRVKDMERRIFREATPEEIESGYFVDEVSKRSEAA